VIHVAASLIYATCATVSTEKKALIIFMHVYTASLNFLRYVQLVHPVAGVLDKPHSQLTPLRGVALQARQSTYIGWNPVQVSILCSLAG
jgi:hypothetical protein